MKIVINVSYHPFILSEIALNYVTEMGSDPTTYESTDDLKKNRNDPNLVYVVERFKKSATYGASLKVCTIPETATDWMIIDYDSYETLYYVEDGIIKEYV